MAKEMRVMTPRPLNAETPNTALRTWITDNEVFFKRNQGQIPETPVSLADWRLQVEGLVEKNFPWHLKTCDGCPRSWRPTLWNAPETADRSCRKKPPEIPGPSAVSAMPSGAESA